MKLLFNDAVGWDGIGDGVCDCTMFKVFFLNFSKLNIMYLSFSVRRLLYKIKETYLVYSGTA